MFQKTSFPLTPREIFVDGHGNETGHEKSTGEIYKKKMYARLGCGEGYLVKKRNYII